MKSDTDVLMLLTLIGATKDIRHTWAYDIYNYDIKFILKLHAKYVMILRNDRQVSFDNATQLYTYIEKKIKSTKKERVPDDYNISKASVQLNIKSTES
ncbi:MAG: hypothetical protein DRI46_14100 [Chloroflexi bacterium]|nr:MAG: hypothetical protein DRI46_14100 [Chloroflexota bacterium]